MNALTQMHFYWWEEKGKVCVQNMVGGVKGQYHEHTPEGFRKWKVAIDEKYLHKLDQNVKEK